MERSKGPVQALGTCRSEAAKLLPRGVHILSTMTLRGPAAMAYLLSSLKLEFKMQFHVCSDTFCSTDCHVWLGVASGHLSGHHRF